MRLYISGLAEFVVAKKCEYYLLTLDEFSYIVSNVAEFIE